MYIFPMTTSLSSSKQSAAQGAGVPTIWLDGEWHERDTATVSVYDHGLLYGDGVFEGIRIYGGKIFRLKEHLDRLYDSAHAIWLTVPIPKDEFAALTEEAVRRSGIREGYIRPIVTRGAGDLGLDPRKCPRPSVIIIVDTIKLWPEEVYETGLKVVTAGTPIPQRESLSPRVKSLNYLAHILAKIEGTQAGADEVLMLDSSGSVAEGSGQNLFVVKQGKIRTPAAFAGILKGVTRDVVIELAVQAGYDVQETILNRYDVYTADEAFFTGTAAEVVAIRQVDGRLIGAGKSGPVTRDLRARFQALVRS
ncbi:MAG TPA: branched-chain-amino-acid transaminase [Gemmatimonadales bacterium]|nr:branched-chain-amino-acid transaminase [Gemmatimonadales bacterium]